MDDLKEASAFALGCPAMGAEVLEEGEMRKHFAWYTAGIKHAAALRNEANQVTNLEQFDGLVDRILEGLH